MSPRDYALLQFQSMHQNCRVGRFVHGMLGVTNLGRIVGADPKWPAPALRMCSCVQRWVVLRRGSATGTRGGQFADLVAASKPEPAYQCGFGRSVDKRRPSFRGRNVQSKHPRWRSPTRLTLLQWRLSRRGPADLDRAASQCKRYYRCTAGVVDEG